MVQNERFKHHYELLHPKVNRLRRGNSTIVSGLLWGIHRNWRVGEPNLQIPDRTAGVLQFASEFAFGPAGVQPAHGEHRGAD